MALWRSAADGLSLSRQAAYAGIELKEETSMSESQSSGFYEVLSPSGPMGVPQVATAPRPSSITGKKIALVWNYVFRGNEIFPVIESALKEKFGEVEFVSYDNFGSVMGGDEEAVLDDLPGKLADLGVTGVITGVGC
jgi:hypothetical protein